MEGDPCRRSDCDCTGFVPNRFMKSFCTLCYHSQGHHRPLTGRTRASASAPAIETKGRKPDSKMFNRILEELVDTERKYIEDIKSISNEWYNIFKTEYKPSELKSDDALNELERMFNSIPALIAFHTEIMLPNVSILQEKGRTFPPNFKNDIQGLRIYENYYKSVNKVLFGDGKSKKIMEFLRKRKSQPPGESEAPTHQLQRVDPNFESYAIKPHQRFFKYGLLLEGLYKYATGEKIAENYQALKQTYNKIASDQNELHKAMERWNVMKIIQNQFSSDVPILEPHREYVGERKGVLVKEIAWKDYAVEGPSAYSANILQETPKAEVLREEAALFIFNDALMVAHSRVITLYKKYVMIFFGLYKEMAFTKRSPNSLMLMKNGEIICLQFQTGQDRDSLYDLMVKETVGQYGRLVDRLIVRDKIGALNRRFLSSQAHLDMLELIMPIKSISSVDNFFAGSDSMYKSVFNYYSESLRLKMLLLRDIAFMKRILHRSRPEEKVDALIRSVALLGYREKKFIAPFLETAVGMIDVIRQFSREERGKAQKSASTRSRSMVYPFGSHLKPKGKAVASSSMEIKTHARRRSTMTPVLKKKAPSMPKKTKQVPTKRIFVPKSRSRFAEDSDSIIAEQKKAAKPLGAERIRYKDVLLFSLSLLALFVVFKLSTYFFSGMTLFKAFALLVPVLIAAIILSRLKKASSIVQPVVSAVQSSLIRQFSVPVMLLRALSGSLLKYFRRIFKSYSVVRDVQSIQRIIVELEMDIVQLREASNIIKNYQKFHMKGTIREEVLRRTVRDIERQFSQLRRESWKEWLL